MYLLYIINFNFIDIFKLYYYLLVKIHYKKGKTRNIIDLEYIILLLFTVWLEITTRL